MSLDIVMMVCNKVAMPIEYMGCAAGELLLWVSGPAHCLGGVGQARHHTTKTMCSVVPPAGPPIFLGYLDVP